MAEVSMDMPMDDDSGGMPGMDMAMYFQGGTMVTILFKGWMTDSAGSYAGAFIAVVLVGVVRQLLLALRRKVAVNMSLQPGNEVLAHLVDTLFFAAAITLGYFNMLIAMTYNIGLFIAVLLGETIGAALFSPSRPLRGILGAPPSQECGNAEALLDDAETGISCH